MTSDMGRAALVGHNRNDQLLVALTCYCKSHTLDVLFGASSARGRCAVSILLLVVGPETKWIET